MTSYTDYLRLGSILFLQVYLLLPVAGGSLKSDQGFKTRLQSLWDLIYFQYKVLGHIPQHLIWSRGHRRTVVYVGLFLKSDVDYSTVNPYILG